MLIARNAVRPIIISKIHTRTLIYSMLQSCAKVWHEIQGQKLNKIRIHAMHMAFTRKCSCQQDSASWNPPVSNAGYLYNHILHLLDVALQYCRRSGLRKNGHWTVFSWISLFYYCSFLQDECLVHLCSVVKHKRSVPLTETQTSSMLKISEDTFYPLPLKVGAKKLFQWMSIVITFPFGVEYIYGFVGWGVCRQSRWRHSVTVPHTRWRVCITMATLWQQQDGGYMLLWKRYGNNKMAAMRFLHLQQYSHRLNFFLKYKLLFKTILTSWSLKVL